MDFELNAEQRAIVEAVERLLEQRAGAARAIELYEKGGYDGDLEAALSEAGFIDVALGEETGFLDAVLVVEAVARAGGVVGMGAAALAGPTWADPFRHGFRGLDPQNTDTFRSRSTHSPDLTT